jgi:hypothetical protein
MSILMPIAPRIKSTIAAVPIHIIRISLFSVFGSFCFVIDFSPFGSATGPVCAGHKRGIQAVGQPLIIENRPGAATNIAVNAIVKSHADGYRPLIVRAANAINVICNSSCLTRGNALVAVLYDVGLETSIDQLFSDQRRASRRCKSSIVGVHGRRRDVSSWPISAAKAAGRRVRLLG